MRALFLWGVSARLPISRIVKRMRRWTGFCPSSTEGSARPFTTLIAYARYAREANSAREGASGARAGGSPPGGAGGGGGGRLEKRSPDRSSACARGRRVV